MFPPDNKLSACQCRDVQSTEHMPQKMCPLLLLCCCASFPPGLPTAGTSVHPHFVISHLRPPFPFSFFLETFSPASNLIAHPTSQRTHSPPFQRVFSSFLLLSTNSSQPHFSTDHSFLQTLENARGKKEERRRKRGAWSCVDAALLLHLLSVFSHSSSFRTIPLASAFRFFRFSLSQQPTTADWKANPTWPYDCVGFELLVIEIILLLSVPLRFYSRQFNPPFSQPSLYFV